MPSVDILIKLKMKTFFTLFKYFLPYFEQREILETQLTILAQLIMQWPELLLQKTRYRPIEKNNQVNIQSSSQCTYVEYNVSTFQSYNLLKFNTNMILKRKILVKITYLKTDSITEKVPLISLDATSTVYTVVANKAALIPTSNLEAYR